jgi:uncharacterized protein YheU (UPF0270 family)
MRGSFVLAEGPIWIPWQHVSPETLEQVVTSHLAAQVGDMNAEDCDLPSAVTRVLAEIRQGVWRVVFEPESATVSLVPAQDFPET